MTNTLMISSSDIPVNDPHLFKRILQLLERNRIPFVLIGALATIVHLTVLHDKKPVFGTRDIDLAIQVESWPTYERIVRLLVTELDFKKTAFAHKLEKELTKVDVIPFGTLEHPSGYISWPQDPDTVMHVGGFQTVLAHSIRCQLEDATTILIPSFPGLVFLKLHAWLNRHEPRDATHLRILLSGSFDLLQDEIFDRHVDLLTDETTNTEMVGCHACGRSIRQMFDSDQTTLEWLVAELKTEFRENEDRLVLAMAGRDPDVEAAMRLYANWLSAFSAGLND